MFQFQTGAIKREEARDILESALVSFNSKLVRLKVDGHKWTAMTGARMFQFQTGAIKSEGDALTDSNNVRFQFQTGAIKRHTITLRH